VDPDTLGQLYSVEPDEFVAERKRLEKSLRDEGRAEEAAEVAALRKPSQPVFLANRLARWQPDLVAQLVEDGKRLAGAHEAGDAEQLRAVQRDLAGRVDALIRIVPGLSGAIEQRLAGLLRTAATNPATADLLRRGVLSEEVEPTAFDALAGMTLAAPKARPKPGRKAEPAPERKPRRVEELEGKLAEARRALREAERVLRKAQSDHERAARRIAQLTEKLEDARR
jgi:uncharacterized coiled-coil protein SlyX